MTSIFIDEMNAEPDTLTPLNITPTRHSMPDIIHCLQLKVLSEWWPTGRTGRTGQGWAGHYSEKIIEMKRK